MVDSIIDDSVAATGWSARVAAESRRVEIRALLHEFNRAIVRRGDARHARLILQRTIEALEGRMAIEHKGQPLPRILRDLKAVRELWGRRQTETVTPEFAHAMDSLLMYEVREESHLGDEYRREMSVS